MYKRIDVSLVEKCIENGKEVLMADFAEEDVENAMYITLDDWQSIKNEQSDRYVFVAKVNDNEV